jgi:hypothetical protein
MGCAASHLEGVSSSALPSPLVLLARPLTGWRGERSSARALLRLGTIPQSTRKLHPTFAAQLCRNHLENASFANRHIPVMPYVRDKHTTSSGTQSSLPVCAVAKVELMTYAHVPSHSSV